MVLNFAIITVVTVNLLFLKRLLLGAAGLQNHSPFIKVILSLSRSENSFTHHCVGGGLPTSTAFPEVGEESVAE